MDILQQAIRTDVLTIFKVTADLRHQLASIPAAFWGIIVGAFFSLGGVTLTNRANDRRLRAQFDHESLQKSKERQMALRREVYLAAADAIYSGLSSIGRFANLEIPSDQVTSEYFQKSSAIAKIHVIAKTGTVREVVNFTGELNALFLKLSAKRIQLVNEKNAIDLIDNQIEQFGKERDRILELMKQHNIEGSTDTERWNRLQGNFDFEVNRVNEALANRAQAVENLKPKHFDSLRRCIEHSAEMDRLLIPALTSIRTELELPLDGDAYQQMLAESAARQQQALDDFLGTFERQDPQPAQPENT